MTTLTESLAERTKQYSLYEWGDQTLTPLEIVRSAGVYLYGPQDQRYLDLNSVSMNVNIGHGDMRVVEAVTRQMTELSTAGPMMATPIRAEVSEMLSAVTPPGLSKVFWTNGGTDANEAAIRTARLVTGRHKILTRRRSYHGGTLGSLSASGDPRRWPIESGVTGIVRIPDPYWYRHPEYSDPAAFRDANLAEIEDIVVQEGPHTIAAIMVEPITGSNGIIVPPHGWLAGLRALCDRYGILLICDEVMSGFGRTGAWFAVDHEEVVPDILTCAKGITSGYVQLGACVVSEDIAAWVHRRPLGSGLTYNSHVVALAAAKANLEIYASDDLLARAAARGEYLLRGLQRLALTHPSVGDVRGRGLFTAIELVHDRTTRDSLFTIAGETSAVPGRMVQRMLDDGVHAALRGPYLFANPPLIISEQEIDEGLAALDRALDLADEATASAGAPIPQHLTRSYPTPWKQ